MTSFMNITSRCIISEHMNDITENSAVQIGGPGLHVEIDEVEDII